MAFLSGEMSAAVMFKPTANLWATAITALPRLSCPLLKPYTSKNVDLSFEWYYEKGALLSFAFFYKHLDTFIQTITSQVPFAGNTAGLPVSLVQAACGTSYGAACNENLIWNFSQPINSKGSPLY